MPLHWRSNGTYHGLEYFVQWMWQIRFYPHGNQSFRRNQPISKKKLTTRTRFARVHYLRFGGSNRYFCQRLYLYPPPWNYQIPKGKTLSVRVFLFRHLTLPSFGLSCVPMNTTLFNILWFSCQGTSRDIVYKRSCWFSWLIFVQHGLYGILLSLY